MPEALAYGIVDAAQIVGVGRTKFYSEIKAGRVRTIQIGRRHLVTRAALEEYVAQLDGEARPATSVAPS